MALRLCVLGSGSAGNCIFVASERTAVLVDAGLSGMETFRRLDAIGENPASIGGICVSHEHGDHIGGLAGILRRLDVEVFADSATAQAAEPALKGRVCRWRVFTPGFAFTVGDIEILPFPVCHDAYDPVGFVLSDGKSRIGIATDIGMATGLVRERLRGCDALVVESNHDEGMLRDAKRPWSLKQRISGRQGHLSNKLCAELLAECYSSRLVHVFLAHLSADCNKPELAIAAAAAALAAKGGNSVAITAASQGGATGVWRSGRKS